MIIINTSSGAKYTFLKFLRKPPEIRERLKILLQPDIS